MKRSVRKRMIKKRWSWRRRGWSRRRRPWGRWSSGRASSSAMLIWLRLLCLRLARHGHCLPPIHPLFNPNVCAASLWIFIFQLYFAVLNSPLFRPNSAQHLFGYSSFNFAIYLWQTPLYTQCLRSISLHFYFCSFEKSPFQIYVTCMSQLIVKF